MPHMKFLASGTSRSADFSNALMAALAVVLIRHSFALAEPATNPAAPTNKRNSQLTAIAPGSAALLGPLNLEDPEGEGKGSARRVTDYSGMVYDPHNHRILMFGGGHATTYTDTIYAFDFTSLTWKSLYKPTPKRFYKLDNMDKGFWKAGGDGPYPRPAARHTYDLLVVPDHRKELLLLRNGCGPSSEAPGIPYFGGAGGAYDFATGKWEAFPVPFGGYGAVSEYDPVSRKVIGGIGQDISLFDPDTRQTTTILRDVADKYKVSTYAGTMVYFPPDNCMYTIPASKKIWKLELDRDNFANSKVVTLSPTGNVPAESECAFAWDPDRKILGGGILKNMFYIFDPPQKAWSATDIKGDQPGDMTFHCLVYDPVDRVYVFIAKQGTYAYRMPEAGK